MKRAIFPGTFDPFTKGHLEIVQTSLTIFDELIIVLARNSNKTTVFNLTETIDKIIKLCNQTKGLSFVHLQDNLTANVCEYLGAKFIVRGLRNNSDYEYENQMFKYNKLINPSITTIFIPTENCISSSFVRELYLSVGGDKHLKYII